MIFNNHESFCDQINKITEDECEDLYIIMRSGYSMKDILDSDYNIELLQYEAGEYVWLNDWYEGQQYIELYDMIPEEKLLDILFHTRSNEDITD